MTLWKRKESIKRFYTTAWELYYPFQNIIIKVSEILNCTFMYEYDVKTEHY